MTPDLIIALGGLIVAVGGVSIPFIFKDAITRRDIKIAELSGKVDTLQNLLAEIIKGKINELN